MFKKTAFTLMFALSIFALSRAAWAPDTVAPPITDAVTQANTKVLGANESADSAPNANELLEEQLEEQEDLQNEAIEAEILSESSATEQSAEKVIAPTSVTE